MSDLTPRTEAGKRLLYDGDLRFRSIRDAILAIEAEAAALPRRWPVGPTDRDGNPVPEPIPDTPSLREAASALIERWEDEAESIGKAGNWSVQAQRTAHTMRSLANDLRAALAERGTE